MISEGKAGEFQMQLQAMKSTLFIITVAVI
jgi:hypothetical protein